MAAKWKNKTKKLVLFLVSGKHSTANRFSALLMEQPMAARKSLPQRQMEQRTGDVKVDTAGVMTTRHLSFSRYCNCTIVVPLMLWLYWLQSQTTTTQITAVKELKAPFFEKKCLGARNVLMPDLSHCQICVRANLSNSLRPEVSRSQTCFMTQSVLELSTAQWKEYFTWNREWCIMVHLWPEYFGCKLCYSHWSMQLQNCC